MCISVSQLVWNIGRAVFAGIAAFAGVSIFPGLAVFARLRRINVTSWRAKRAYTGGGRGVEGGGKLRIATLVRVVYMCRTFISLCRGIGGRITRATLHALTRTFGSCKILIF